MKINFELPKDNRRHRYCRNCHSETVHDAQINNKNLYKCDDCGQVHDRLIDIDPQLVYRVDKKNKEYWHESVGVIVTNKKSEILLLERTIFPYGLTIPAGHLESNETPEKAALKELEEETGIKTKKLTKIGEENIKEACRRGADYHHWYLFTHQLEKMQTITPDEEEGKNPVWLPVKEALTKKLSPPTKYLLTKYQKPLLS